MSLTALASSASPVFSGSKRTAAFSVARLTVASTPSRRLSARSTLATHEAQDMPPILSSVVVLDIPWEGINRAKIDGMREFGVDEVRRGLERDGGGYEIVHESPGLEIGVYVLVSPEPDRQQPHDDDEVYVVLDGRGVLEIEGERV